MAEAEGIALNVVMEVEAVNLKRELMESHPFPFLWTANFVEKQAFFTE